jgi:hypothetical protein
MKFLCFFCFSFLFFLLAFLPPSFSLKFISLSPYSSISFCIPYKTTPNQLLVVHRVSSVCAYVLKSTRMLDKLLYLLRELTEIQSKLYHQSVFSFQVSEHNVSEIWYSINILPQLVSMLNLTVVSVSDTGPFFMLRQVEKGALWFKQLSPFLKEQRAPPVPEEPLGWSRFCSACSTTFGRAGLWTLAWAEGPVSVRSVWVSSA